MLYCRDVDRTAVVIVKFYNTDLCILSRSPIGKQHCRMLNAVPDIKSAHILGTQSAFFSF